MATASASRENGSEEEALAALRRVLQAWSGSPQASAGEPESDVEGTDARALKNAAFLDSLLQLVAQLERLNGDAGRSERGILSDALCAGDARHLEPVAGEPCAQSEASAAVCGLLTSELPLSVAESHAYVRRLLHRQQLERLEPSGRDCRPRPESLPGTGAVSEPKREMPCFPLSRGEVEPAGLRRAGSLPSPAALFRPSPASLLVASPSARYCPKRPRHAPPASPPQLDDSFIRAILSGEHRPLQRRTEEARRAREKHVKDEAMNGIDADALKREHCERWKAHVGGLFIPIFDTDDEYRDDYDPGYRILDLAEAHYIHDCHTFRQNPVDLVGGLSACSRRPRLSAHLERIYASRRSASLRDVRLEASRCAAAAAASGVKSEGPGEASQLPGSCYAAPHAGSGERRGSPQFGAWGSASGAGGQEPRLGEGRTSRVGPRPAFAPSGPGTGASGAGRSASPSFGLREDQELETARKDSHCVFEFRRDPAESARDASQRGKEAGREPRAVSLEDELADCTVQVSSVFSTSKSPFASSPAPEETDGAGPAAGSGGSFALTPSARGSRPAVPGAETRAVRVETPAGGGDRSTLSTAEEEQLAAYEREMKVCQAWRDRYCNGDPAAFRARQQSTRSAYILSFEGCRDAEPAERVAPSLASDGLAPFLRPLYPKSDDAFYPVRVLPFSRRAGHSDRRSASRSVDREELVREETRTDGAEAGESERANKAAKASDALSQQGGVGATRAPRTSGAEDRGEDAPGIEGAQTDSAKRRMQRDSVVATQAAQGHGARDNGAPAIVYDCFHLKVVFERGRTGFEDHRELVLPPGTLLAGRYQVEKEVGRAAFSRCLRCIDTVTNRQVCLKVIRNEKEYMDQSLDEVKTLRFLSANGDPDALHFLRLCDFFYHREHLVLVTELLSQNLYEFSSFFRKNHLPSFWTVGKIQRVAQELLVALRFVHSLNVVHCDLKPENILLQPQAITDTRFYKTLSQQQPSAVVAQVFDERACRERDLASDREGLAVLARNGAVGTAHASPLSPFSLQYGSSASGPAPGVSKSLSPEAGLHAPVSVKLIDFGNSCLTSDPLITYVQSRSYRAPEVLLELPYDTKIDIWSLGCVLFELWTSVVLFMNDSVHSLLARIVGIIGQLPWYMVEKSPKKEEFFDSDGYLYVVLPSENGEWSPGGEAKGKGVRSREDEKSREEGDTDGKRSGRDASMDAPGRMLRFLLPKRTSLRQRMRATDEVFIDFLEKMLIIDPAQRWDANQLLSHPFLDKHRYADGL